MATDIDRLLSELRSLSIDEMHLARKTIDDALSKAQATDAHRQRDALNKLRERMKKLPVHNPDDGLSNRDHDQILYGTDQ